MNFGDKIKVQTKLVKKRDYPRRIWVSKNIDGTEVVYLGEVHLKNGRLFNDGYGWQFKELETFKAHRVCARNRKPFYISDEEFKEAGE